MADELPEDVTVTMRAAKAAVALPGHDIRECEQCSHDVVINPATITEIERGVYPDYIVCMTCSVEADTDG